MAMHNYEDIKSYTCTKKFKHQFPTEINETRNARHAMSPPCFPTKNEIVFSIVTFITARNVNSMKDWIKPQEDVWILA